MANESYSQKESGPEKPTPEAIDEIISEIENLRGPRDAQEDIFLQVNPEIIHQFAVDTETRLTQEEVTEAYFDATHDLATSLVIRLDNGNSLTYLLDSYVGGSADPQAKKLYVHAGEDASKLPPYRKEEVTLEDMKIITGALESLINAREIERAENERLLPHLRAATFRQGAARLIAHGDPVDMSKMHEKALFEDRPPSSFTFAIPEEHLPYRTSGHPERVVSADLTFIERRIDIDASPEDEPAPDSVRLSVQSIDINGNECESEYTLERDVGADDDEITGYYYRTVAGSHSLEGLLDEGDDRNLTTEDLAVFRRAIESMPPAPHMEAQSPD